MPFVAAPWVAEPFVATSLDGLTWASVPIPTARTFIAGIYVGSTIILNDQQGNYVVSTDDGATFADAGTMLDTSLNPIGAYGFYGGVFYAISEMGAIATSPDGLAWTWLSTTIPWLLSTYLQPSVIAVGDDGTLVVGSSANYQASGFVYVSKDLGATWSSVNLFPTNNWQVTVGYGGGVYVAVAQWQGMPSCIATSVDAVTWVSNTTDALVNGPQFPSFDPLVGRWVCACEGGNMFTAPASATHWTETASGYGVWTDSSDGVYLVVGGPADQAYRSTDGVNWSLVNLPATGNIWNIVIGHKGAVAASDVMAMLV